MKDRTRRTGTRAGRILVTLAVAVTMFAVPMRQAQAATATLGVAFQSYSAVTFSNNYTSAAVSTTDFNPIGLTVGPDNMVYVADPKTAQIFRYNPASFTPGNPFNSQSYVVGTASGYSIWGLAFATDPNNGSVHLYATVQGGSQIVELDWAGGTYKVLRSAVDTTSTNCTAPLGIAFDPASYGLMYTCSDGDGTVNYVPPSEYTDYTGAHIGQAQELAAVLSYGTAAGGSLDGLVWDSADNTWFVAADPVVVHFAGYGNTKGLQPGAYISSFNAPGGSTTPDGLVIATNKYTGKHFLITDNNNQTMSQVLYDPTTGQYQSDAMIYSGGSRGDFATLGPDGCVYATQSDIVVRVADGLLSCTNSTSTSTPTTSTTKSCTTCSSTQITGMATGEYHDPSMATVTLSACDTTGNCTPYANSTAKVTVTINGTTCTASTDANGNVSCPFTPVLQNPADGSSSFVGGQWFTASYPGDNSHTGTSATLPATIKREETSIFVQNQVPVTMPDGTTVNAVPIQATGPATLSARLYDDSAIPDGDAATSTPKPLPGSLLDSTSVAYLVLNTNSGGHYSCWAFPDSNGYATCQASPDVNETGSGIIGTITAIWSPNDSDHTYITSTNSAPVVLFNSGNIPGDTGDAGLFVIGDKAADVWAQNQLISYKSGRQKQLLSYDQTNTYFWGSQWENTQDATSPSTSQAGFIGGFTYGHDPDSMKGYALVPVSKFWCGYRYTTKPGNSPPPPVHIGDYVRVIISTWVRKQPGPTISGDIKAIVLVRVTSSYVDNPGHPGRGPIVAWLCGAPSYATGMLVNHGPFASSGQPGYQPQYQPLGYGPTVFTNGVVQWSPPYAPGSNGNSGGFSWGSGFSPYNCDPTKTTCP